MLNPSVPGSPMSSSSRSGTALSSSTWSVSTSSDKRTWWPPIVRASAYIRAMVGSSSTRTMSPNPRPLCRGHLHQLVPELAADHFAHARLGQAAEEMDLFGRLVLGQALAAEGQDLVGARLGVVTQDDEGDHLLAVPRVGPADHRGLGHRRVFEQHFLDVARVNVEAAADDQVLLAINDVEVAFGVHAPDIARVQPSVTDGLGGCIWHPVLALHDVCPP